MAIEPDQSPDLRACARALDLPSERAPTHISGKQRKTGCPHTYGLDTKPQEVVPGYSWTDVAFFLGIMTDQGVPINARKLQYEYVF